jgi:ABC-type bacteriocin/lantibiotic exporter with double-glycine peptidase domain
MLAGLDLPTEGDITFDGSDLKSLDLDRYRREI